MYTHARTHIHNGIKLVSKVKFWKIINKHLLKQFFTATGVHKFTCIQK